MPFSVFKLHPEIVRGIKDLAFTRPTPIQSEAIPPALAGRDLLASAATGSGKTAAFMLPTIHRLMTTRPPQRTTRALVLTPTRELCVQIHQNLLELATHTPITGAPIYGGVSMGPQEHAFRAGADILIATPGRLLDHLKRSYAKLDKLEVLIMDEADRMLDMGFLPDIRRILKALPEKRQTLFFSATMPPEIRQLTQQLLKNPVVIQIERQSAPASGITQAIYPVSQHLKAQLLVELLKNQELESVICFTRTKHRANRLADHLRRKNIACAAIHGNRTQAQRNAALAGFKNKQFRVLVATDVAARGIDIQEVSHVINFDCPHIADDYIHRVGRTGRAAATGDAFTFIAPDEEGNLRTIERAIGKRLPRVTLPEFDYGAKSTEALEIPIAARLAAMRAQRAGHGARRGPGGPPRHHANTGGPSAPPRQHTSAPAPGSAPRHNANTGAPRTLSAPGASDPMGGNRPPQSGRYQGQGKKKLFGRNRNKPRSGNPWGQPHHGGGHGGK